MPVIRAGECTDAHGDAAKPEISGENLSFSSEQQMSLPRLEAHQSVCTRTPTATENAPSLLPEMLPADPDLAILVNTWDRLPEAVRAGIVAMVKAASK